jgi:hypothetical protein
VASIYRLQEQIATLMFGGASLARVEDEVIDPSGLSPDHKAGLWLYAWSYMSGADQRAQARSYLTSLN